MKDALTRLRALQQELETLHRTTAEVLAQSERLIGEFEEPSTPAAAPEPPAKPKRQRARRSATRARKGRG